MYFLGLSRVLLTIHHRGRKRMRRETFVTLLCVVLFSLPLATKHFCPAVSLLYRATNQFELIPIQPPGEFFFYGSVCQGFLGTEGEGEGNESQKELSEEGGELLVIGGNSTVTGKGMDEIGRREDFS